MKLFNQIIPKGFKFAISKLRFSASSILAKISVKRGHPLIDNLFQIIYTMGGKITPNWVRVCSKLVFELYLLNKHGGPKQLVKYLKVCSICLQQAAAGYVLPDLTPLGMRIARSKSGLPKIIPAHHRKSICDGDEKILRFWLTIFSIYRDIHFDGELKLKTIIEPCTVVPDYGVYHKFSKAFKDLFFRSSDFVIESSNANLFPILTSGPQVSKSEGVSFNSHSMSVLRSLIVFNSQPHLFDSLFILAQHLYCTRVIDIIHSFKTYWFERTYNINIKNDDLGKLAIKEEAAGKVRVFAMVDPLTQWVLAPLHRNLFNCLKRIKMDGTFNQLKPLKEIPFGKVPLFSFDLSAATDRLPIELQKIILSSFYSPEFAHHWANLLVGRHYGPPHLSNKKIKGGTTSNIFYSVGQPMGALSSWAMLAMTHHFIVQCAAWSCGTCSKTTLFTEYAVLGDDIVIWNRAVAFKYLSLMKGLGVEVGLAKSIISPHGKGIEFAKRTIVSGVDVSPIPFREQGAAHTSLSILKEYSLKYNMSYLHILRFLGYGYKVDPQKNNRINRAINTAWSIPTTPGELIKLFETNTFGLGQKVTPNPALLRKTLITLVYDELIKISLQAKNLSNSVLTYSVGTSVDRVFRPGMISLITAEMADSVVPDWLTILSFTKHTALLHISCIKDIMEFYHSFMFDAPEIFLSPRQRLESKDFKSALNFIFTAQKDLDTIQCDNLLNPRPSISQSPSFLERERVLRLWARWAQIFMLVDTTLFDYKNSFSQKH
jgi:hypothetical protein